MIELQETLQLIFNLLSSYIGFPFFCIEHSKSVLFKKMDSFSPNRRGFTDLVKASECH